MSKALFLLVFEDVAPAEGILHSGTQSCVLCAVKRLPSNKEAKKDVLVFSVLPSHAAPPPPPCDRC